MIERRRWDSFTTGIAGALAFGLALVLLVGLATRMAPSADAEGPGFTLGIGLALVVGVTQLPFVLPAAALAWWRSYRRLAKGLLIGAAIMLAVNAVLLGLLALAIG